MTNGPEQLPALAVDVLDALDGPACLLDPQAGILVVNAAWRDFAVANGALPERTGPGVSYLDCCATAASYGEEEDRAAATAVAAGLRRVLSGEQRRFTLDYPCHSPDEQRWFSVHVSPVTLPEGTGAVVRHVDITTRQQALDALGHLALHDPLTGLPNRALLLDRLEQAAADAARRDSVLGVAVVDVDRFRHVNATLGPDLGDVVLRQVADRLVTLVQTGDTVARTAGDEFVVLWRDLAAVEDVQVLGSRLGAQLAQVLDLDGTSLPLTCSVGTAAGRPWVDETDLVSQAGSALAQARGEGHGLVRNATAALGRRAAAERLKESELRRALERDELVVHYQPVVSLASGRPVGVEALVRWQHPDGALLVPQHFLPVAERSDLVVPLDRWVLRRACQDAADPQGPLAGLSLSVNLSPRQLAQPDVVEHVRGALLDSGLDPGRLCLEVTESAVVGEEQTAQRALQALVALGVCMALDDFGTGYSSLMYVRRYPVDVLKLDRSFVSGIGSSADDEAICGSVVKLARSVGATCVAEGVETTQQLALLASFGCQQAQGWLWSPAVPLAGLATALQTTARVPLAAETPVRDAPLLQLVPEVAAQIQQLHSEGASLHTIAAALNRSGARHPAGVRWGVHAVARYVATTTSGTG